MRGKLTKRFGMLMLSAVILTSSILPVNNIALAADFSYDIALKDSILFYDANKCGKDVAANNVFDWRAACHTTDGSDAGLDLTGGYHDAGDHVKFGLPQGYAASVLGWALYEFKDVFDNTGNTEKMKQQLKYFTDYFLKSHTDANTFYYQIGEGNADHAYWGAPEQQTGARPSQYKADASNPASDVLGETAAALALMYLNYKDTDASYANRCLAAAKELYNMGKANKGYSNGQSFYQSTSYGDDLAWGAAWLYTATADSTYLTDAEQFITIKNKNGDTPLMDKWTMCWDDMYLPAALKLYQLTNKQMYKDAVQFNMNYWKNELQTTAGGLKYLNNWGVLRYAASEAMVACIYYKDTQDQSLLSLAKSQIDYILGSNPANMSYIIGFGSNWSLHPHHRAANGYTYANGDNAKPAKHLLLGALVGGPDTSDAFKDDVNQYQYTEVAIDYNAGLVGALAGMVKYYGNTTPVNNSTISPTSASFDRNSSKQADIVVALTLNGNTFNGIKNGTALLVSGTDYTITGNTVTVLKSYLAKQPTGTTALTFDFSAGTDPALIVTVADTSPASAISPTAAAFDKNTSKQADVSVTLTLNGNLFTGINNGSAALVRDSDYTVSGNTVTISKNYLAKQPVGTTALTFDVSSGTDPVLTVTVSDSSVVQGNIKLKFYNSNLAEQSNSLYGKFNLVNTGTTDISLSDVKIRYYYTIDGEKAQSFWCDWSSAGSSNVTGTFVKMPSVKTGADYYLEIGFTSGAGTLKAGQSIEVQTRAAKSDWTNYNQADDYSFNSTATGYTDWTKVTGYVSGSLNWGVEP